MEIDHRREALEYLAAVQNHYGFYHNHKENAAWAAVIFFGALATAVLSVLKEFSTTPLLYYLAKAITTAFAILVGFVFVLYLRKQFELRKRGGDYVHACWKLRGEILSGNHSVTSQDWLPQKPGTDSNPQTYTDSRKEMATSEVLPWIIRDYADKLSPSHQGALKRLETYAYVMLISQLLFLVVMIWIRM
jgi:hypothetical protein